MSLKKQYLKSRPVCKVTFVLDATSADGAKEAAVLGDFNSWDPTDATMKKAKDGTFSRTYELETGKEYQFRYLIDNTRWVNDTEADKLVYSGVASEQNCVVVLEA